VNFQCRHNEWSATTASVSPAPVVKIGGGGDTHTGTNTSYRNAHVFGGIPTQEQIRLIGTLTCSAVSRPVDLKFPTFGSQCIFFQTRAVLEDVHFRLILHERSKRGSWDAPQNAWRRQLKLSMRKYINARSNLDERFWRLQFGVSPASSDSNAVRGVNACARNVVQSTLRRFIFWNLPDY
jgi:hypothetical protein